jgi:hypothetical protein
MIPLKLPDQADVYEAASAVLGTLLGPGDGKVPGGFTRDLILLACHADPENKAKLALGFPAIITAVDIYKNKHDGVEVLRRLASKTPSTQPGEGFSPKGN